jgi:phage repressor protein C with HTH and peptisase S24 domain
MPTNVGEGPATFRMELGVRIHWLLGLFENRQEAADIADVTPEHLASYIRGSAKPPFELLNRLASAKGVSLDWLATGEGSQYIEADAPDGFVAIVVQPETEARLADADDADVDAPGDFLFRREWLSSLTRTPDEHLRIVINRGNANEPVIRDGDQLLVDTQDRRIADDALYVFVSDGRYLARFVEKLATGNVALKSRNPDFRVQTLSPEDVAKLQVLGRVLWHGGKM